MEQDLTQFAYKILCNTSSSFDTVDNFFATEGDTMVSILYEYDLDKDYYFILSSEINAYQKQIKVISITSEMI